MLQLPLLLLILTSALATGPRDEVDAAFNELLASISATLSTLKQESDDLQDNLMFDLDDLRAETAVAISSKVQEVTEKLDSMTKNLAKYEINVTDCTDKGFNYLLVYRDQLLLRISECVDTFGSEGLDYLKAAYGELEDLSQNHIECTEKAIGLCKLSDGTNSECFKEVLKKIQSDKVDLPNVLNLLNLEAVNRQQNFQVPCKEMILNDMALYPPALLKTTENCINFEMKKNIKGICGV